LLSSEPQAPSVVDIDPQPAASLQTVMELLSKGLGDNQTGRLLATTADTLNGVKELALMISSLQEDVANLQRPTEDTQEAAAEKRAIAKIVRAEALRWMLANQCNAKATLVQPTPPIVGRALHSQKAFDSRSAKTPHEICKEIYNAVTNRFSLEPEAEGSDGATQIDWIHLTEDVVEVLQDRSNLSRAKRTNHCSKTLEPRVRVLVESGLAISEPVKTGERTNYDRYLTEQGREVFDGWPEWTDVTGGVGLADSEPTGANEQAAAESSGSSILPDSQNSSPPPA